MGNTTDLQDSKMESKTARVEFVETDDTAVVESACLFCGKTGTTRIMLTKIPHFRDIIVISFECPTCGYRNNELQHAAPLQDYGVKITAKVSKTDRLNKQMVISGSATCRIEELDFEMKPLAERGSVTTIEGYLMRIYESLDDHILSIEDALLANPEITVQLTTGEVKHASDYIEMMKTIKDRVFDYAAGLEAFTLILDDPSGNSYIESSDTFTVTVERYERTDEQQKKLGYAVKEDFKKELDLTTPMEDTDDVGKEGFSLPVECPHCGNEGRNKICEVLVPGFGPCVIMAFTCEGCGAKSNEIKPGGGYKDRAKRWTLTVDCISDLNRDVIISETASVRIEHLEMDMSPGTLGAAFTTVEGLLGKIVESLEKAYPFVLGDSAEDTHAPLREKVRQLQALASGDLSSPFVLVIDDPADHSFVGARALYVGDDSNLSVESYDRTPEQDEQLGLTDMKTEDY
ncbi:Zinc finger protein ZPR1 [Babesia sp. Xinjiang]|uniref:Zinc finger protein ZPR1 n=1 Tax=Babesia sp. Xinjiang TaxID=462227 RepID=UPI000A23782C|nr:Zinc finger protein ZPR1 [Babesia sp. Xinjiang]ORM39757.1 Zinc finger protein ZPR1 [Babesia sp. Xinjiang]